MVLHSVRIKMNLHATQWFERSLTRVISLVQQNKCFENSLPTPISPSVSPRSQTGKRFLDRDEPGYADCALAPKLQHLRVAGAYFRGFRIPVKHTHLWMYLSRIYQLESFCKSCPTDRDILLHYVDRILVGQVSELSKQKSRILQIPEDFRLLSCPLVDEWVTIPGNGLDRRSGASGSSSNSRNKRSTSPRCPERKSLQSLVNTQSRDREISSQVPACGLRKFAPVNNLANLDSDTSSGTERSRTCLFPEDRIGNGVLTHASSASLRSLINYSKSIERPNPLYRMIPPSKYFDSTESLIK